jgi:hypothetical protein
MMRHNPVLLLLGALLCGPLAPSAAAQPQSPRPTKPVPTQQFAAPAFGFTLEYPKKDWLLTAGAGAAVVVFVQKSGEATVAIEVLKVPPLAPEDINDQTVKLEIEDWQAKRTPRAVVKPLLGNISTGRVIVLDFTQPGATGSERVRLYALPRGPVWYRVICTATPAAFDKYEAIFHAIATSLTTTPSR